MSNPAEVTILAATLARETRKVSAYKAASDAEALIRLGRRATRIAEQRCNGMRKVRWNAKDQRWNAEWTETDEAKADKAAASIVAKARELLAPYGATHVTANGDPRGRVLRFKLKSGASNGMGEDWGV